MKGKPIGALVFSLFFLCVGQVSGQASLPLKFKLDENNVTSQVSYAPDQSVIAFCNHKDINLYLATTFHFYKKIGEHERNVLRACFSRDGEHILTFGEDNAIRYWNLKKAEEEKEIILDEDIIDGGLLEPGKSVVVTKEGLFVYDLDMRSILFKRKTDYKINSLGVSSAGNLIVVGGPHGNTTLFNSNDGSLLGTYRNQDGLVRAIDIESKGNIVATGDDKGVVIISDRAGAPKQTIKGDAKGWVQSVRFSMDGKYLAVGDDYGDILFYQTATGQLVGKINDAKHPIVSLAFSQDGKDLACTEFQQGLRIYDVSGLGIAPVYLVRDEKDKTPPQIFVSNPPNTQNDFVTSYEAIVDVTGTLMDDAGILSLKINGLNIPIKENNNFIVHEPLSMGDNPVVLEAEDINGNIALRKFIVRRKAVTGDVQYDHTKATNYLFAVGINDYEYWPKLNNAAKDASDIAQVLMDSYGFSPDNLVLLKNEDATRANVYDKLRQLIEKVTPHDNLFIYFSGHGYFDDLLNEGYWIPVDARKNSSGDYLSNSDILKIIRSIDSQHTFLIADACFSGSLFANSRRGYTDNVEKYKSRWGLASGRLEEVSDGALGQNSPFAASVIEFLKNNQKDKVAISELIQYVKFKVAESSDQTPIGNPLKDAGDEGGEMILYHSAGTYSGK